VRKSVRESRVQIVVRNEYAGGGEFGSTGDGLAEFDYEVFALGEEHAQFLAVLAML
jgi:hypothetical protein